jgi:hypothetical protein
VCVRVQGRELDAGRDAPLRTESWSKGRGALFYSYLSASTAGSSREALIAGQSPESSPTSASVAKEVKKALALTHKWMSPCRLSSLNNWLRNGIEPIQ